MDLIKNSKTEATIKLMKEDDGETTTTFLQLVMNYKGSETLPLPFKKHNTSNLYANEIRTAIKDFSNFRFRAPTEIEASLFFDDEPEYSRCILIVNGSFATPCKINNTDYSLIKYVKTYFIELFIQALKGNAETQLREFNTKMTDTRKDVIDLQKNIAKLKAEYPKLEKLLKATRKWSINKSRHETLKRYVTAIDRYGKTVKQQVDGILAIHPFLNEMLKLHPNFASTFNTSTVFAVSLNTFSPTKTPERSIAYFKLGAAIYIGGWAATITAFFLFPPFAAAMKLISSIITAICLALQIYEDIKLAHKLADWYSETNKKLDEQLEQLKSIELKLIKLLQQNKSILADQETLARKLGYVGEAENWQLIMNFMKQELTEYQQQMAMRFTLSSEISSQVKGHPKKRSEVYAEVMESATEIVIENINCRGEVHKKACREKRKRIAKSLAIDWFLRERYKVNAKEKQQVDQYIKQLTKGYPTKEIDRLLLIAAISYSKSPKEALENLKNDSKTIDQATIDQVLSEVGWIKAFAA